MCLVGQNTEVSLEDEVVLLFTKQQKKSAIRSIKSNTLRAKSMA